ncbi:MAG: ABC transporter substrate-binding protein, partial [Desulfobulbia bacterium]
MALDPQMKILLVEDAGTMRKMEARILGQVGFTNIVEAKDGNDAMAKLGAEPDIALVISDWSMPNCDGYQLLQWMREHDAFKNLPFLMATGHGDKAYVAKAKEAGANGVVAKPFTPDELKVLIDEIFGLKQAPAPKKEEGPKMSAEGKVHLKMAHIQITDHLALGVLKHQVASGQKNPLHFSLDTLCMPGWNPVQSALENGAVDGAFILAPMAMDLFSYGVPIKLVLFAHRNGSICVRNKTGKYAKPYQQFFKHKTFYIPHKMSIHNMLAHMYFTQMGLRPGVAGKEAVNVLFDVVPPVAMPEFLKDNAEASGFLVAEPIGSRAITAGIAERQFLSSEVWQDHPCCVVVFREEILSKYPEAVQEFTTMLVEAGLYPRSCGRGGGDRRNLSRSAEKNRPRTRPAPHRAFRPPGDHHGQSLSGQGRPGDHPGLYDQQDGDRAAHRSGRIHRHPLCRYRLQACADRSRRKPGNHRAQGRGQEAGHRPVPGLPRGQVSDLHPGQGALRARHPRCPGDHRP